MPHPLEYHRNVRQLFSPAVALLAITTVFLFLPASSVAQINAPPSSVTSPGFGGRPANGTSPSVTSVGPRGYAPSRGSVPQRPPVDNGPRHHRRDGTYTGPYLYAYPVPYGVDPNAYAETPEPENDEGDYQGGPTVFDRRGSGSRSYVPPVEDVPPVHSLDQSDQPVSAPAPSPSTMLVFKDGHKLEVGNYAIVGSTLFDLTPGHSRRVPLSDLDLDATKKENDDRGVTFDIPTNVGS